MFVSVSITLEDTDDFTMTPTEIAEATLDVLGGDREKDTVQASVSLPNKVSTVGAMAAPPLPPE